jgi:hypothetical protein
MTQIYPLQILAGATTTAIGGIIVWKYRQRARRRRELKDWYKESKSFASKVQKLGERATSFREETDTDLLKSELDPVADKILAHAETAPEGVDDDAVQEMRALSNVATNLGLIVDLHSEHSGVELMKRLQQGIKEKDMDETSQDMDRLNQLARMIDLSDLPPGNIDQNKIDEDALGDLTEQIRDKTLESGEVQSLNEVAEFPFEEMDSAVEGMNPVDEMVSGLLKEYSRLTLIQFTEDLYDRMEERAEKA